MFLCKVFSVYFVLISFSDAVLGTKPKSTVSLRGKRVEFKCRRETSSDSQNPIDWSFASYGRTAHQQFYHNGTLHPNYSRRYEVLTRETGQCDLIIDSVDFSYAGNYRCTSKPPGNRIKSYSAAELVVLDSDPICKANSLNDSEEYEIIAAECHLNYRGNAKPRMECTVNDDRAIINSPLTVNNYTDSTYRDDATLTNMTSSVMTSSITIRKLQNTTITCNITFILINNINNIEDNFEYLHLWTFAPKHRSKAEEERNEHDDSSPHIRPVVIIVGCVFGTACFIIVLLLLLYKKFCTHQRKNQISNQSDSKGLEEQEQEHNTSGIGQSPSSEANETAYETLAEMHALSQDGKQQEMYSKLHIYENTISTTDYENRL